MGPPSKLWLFVRTSKSINGSQLLLPNNRTSPSGIECKLAIEGLLILNLLQSPSTRIQPFQSHSISLPIHPTLYIAMRSTLQVYTVEVWEISSARGAFLSYVLPFKKVLATMTSQA